VRTDEWELTSDSDELEYDVRSARRVLEQ